MKRRTSWVKVSLTAVGAGLVALSIGKGLAAGPPAVPTPADTARSTRELPAPAPGADPRTEVPTGALVAGNGLVESLGREAKLSPHVGGVVERVLVTEGQRVELGAPLLELASTTERASLAAAEAAVKQAEAELTRTLRGTRYEEIEAATRDAAAARARAELSATVLARQEALAKGGASTPDEVDRARGAALADAESARAAESRAKQARNGSRPEDVAVARSKVETAAAQRDEAKARLERMVLRAPAGGEILEVKVRAGEYVQPGGEAAIVLGDTSKLRVRMDLDERDLGKVRVGAAAFATADAFPGQRFAGRVTELGRKMGRKNVRSDDPIERIDTKILEVVIDLDAGRELVPGLRVMAYAESRPASP
jgi:HlyD family secretion protein